MDRPSQFSRPEFQVIDELFSLSQRERAGVRENGSNQNIRQFEEKENRQTGIFCQALVTNPTLLSAHHTPRIHLRSSQTALSEVQLRESKMFFAAPATSPFFRLFQASLALMATNWSTLGSR